ncbi:MULTISPECIES: glycosyltransferase family 87 protein [unclassified Bradyrhizobium]|uniref:glycosyltransferase family 87 protein n=1 Tax=unclassified Bradyrhizobium TaxID=2631580 RepID=UPI0028EC7FAE|nr:MULTISPECIES: glycosyltransferase family 87 protein [unclassified Bradyrhizobium]
MTATSSAAHPKTRDRRAVLILLVAMALYNGAYLVGWALSSPQPAFGDFFGLWSFGRFAALSGAGIYDPVALARYQQMLDPTLGGGGFPYPYPPTFLLVLIPLGMLALPVAYVCWISVTFALYGLATLGRDWRSLTSLALLAAPTTLINAITGQNGFLSAALLIGGLRLLACHPIVAGTLLGLLAYKPQFVLLMPVVLLASRNWRAILSAIATTVIVAIVTSAALDPWIWLEWIVKFPSYQAQLQANQVSLDHMMPTVIAGLHALGALPPIGYLVQLLLSCSIVVMVWDAWRRGSTQQAIALVAVGSIIATPYAMIYDMPMVAAGIAIHWKARSDAGEPIAPLEIGLVIALGACLLAMIGHSVPFAAAILLVLLALSIAGVFDRSGRPLPALDVAPPAAG